MSKKCNSSVRNELFLWQIIFDKLEYIRDDIDKKELINTELSKTVKTEMTDEVTSGLHWRLPVENFYKKQPLTCTCSYQIYVCRSWLCQSDWYETSIHDNGYHVSVDGWEEWRQYH